MTKWQEFLETKSETVDEGTKNWIQGAINPKHKGFCSKLSNKECTPRRKALAKRFKSGDIHRDNEKKGDK